ncbi:MAG: chorismate synthase [Actinomycetes bacterium]|jgi:chorismate synthase|nr:MAG: chorismate synthase [Actinomycetota bacterium]
MIRFLTAGESHGPGLVTIVEGLPKGLAVSADDFAAELERRRRGYGRGGRMKVERDELEILGGIRHGRTLGSPVAVLIRNAEWENWSQVMAPEGEPAGKKVTRPRPGHADLPGMLKYDTDDARDILERASARETAARTIAGVLSRKLLAAVGVDVLSQVVAIGEVSVDLPPPADRDAIEASPVRCPDREATGRMMAVIDAAADARDTLGGVFEVAAHGVPPGIGSHVQWDRKLDGLLAQAVMSIPSIKGVEIGPAFRVAASPGSAAHDEILPGLERASNRAGGMEGGISNGETILVRAAMKPISTLMQPLRTVDVETGEPAQAVRERSDVCAVPAGGVVGEQMVCIVLAREFQRKFGGDTVDDLVDAVARYRERIGW